MRMQAAQAAGQGSRQQRGRAGGVSVRTGLQSHASCLRCSAATAAGRALRAVSGRRLATHAGQAAGQVGSERAVHGRHCPPVLVCLPALCR